MSEREKQNGVAPAGGQPQAVQEIAVPFVAIVAALVFAARHEWHAPVPGEPGMKRLTKRIYLDTDLERGTAVAVIDPVIINYFASILPRMQYDCSVVEIPGAVAPRNRAYQIVFALPRASSLVLANGQPAAGPDPGALAILKQVLG